MSHPNLTFGLRRRVGWIAAVAGALLVSAVPVRAEYHGFNTASGSDGGSSCFYGGMPWDPGGNPPCAVSRWSVNEIRMDEVAFWVTIGRRAVCSASRRGSET